MDAERFEPAGSWHAFAGRRPPYTRPDQGPTGRTIHDLSGADAQHRVHASLDEEGEMGRGTQAPIGHQYITGLSARMDRLHPGKIMGQEGRNDQLQEHTCARMEQSQEPGDGEAAPRPLRRRLAEGGLQGRSIWHGASEPSTKTVRWPCHRPSSKADRGTALPKCSRRRSKKRNGSLARA
jgi:hypothetical protein